MNCKVLSVTTAENSPVAKVITEFYFVRVRYQLLYYRITGAAAGTPTAY